MNTERLSLIDTMKAESRGLTQGEARALSQASISMGRYGRRGEFAAAATWRCAVPASYQTGALVNVGGVIRSI